MRLTVETGPLAGTRISLERDRATTIGSGEDQDLRVVEPGVAAEHAVVKALRDHGFGVKALAPGLRVNGNEIEAAPLEEGDILEVGTTRITYGEARKSKGPEIPGFKVLGKLGQGGMGVVYRAEQVSLHREVDWVAKYHIVDRYRIKHQLPLGSGRLSLLDLAYHDVNRERGLYYLLERKGLMDRTVTDDAIMDAISHPPKTTRARLRGEFIKAAKAKKRDFTVDWVHLKLNDQAQRTVLCKDPFKAIDERVERLIRSL